MLMQRGACSAAIKKHRTPFLSRIIVFFFASLLRSLIRRSWKRVHRTHHDHTISLILIIAPPKPVRFIFRGCEELLSASRRSRAFSALTIYLRTHVIAGGPNRDIVDLRAQRSTLNLRLISFSYPNAKILRAPRLYFALF